MDVMELPIPAATPSKPVSSDDVTRKREKYQGVDSKLKTTLILGEGQKSSPEPSESTRTPSSTNAPKTITTTSGGSPPEEVDTPEVDAKGSAAPKSRRRRGKKSKVAPPVPPVPAGWLEDDCDDDPEAEQSEPGEVADAKGKPACQVLHSESRHTHTDRHTPSQFQNVNGLQCSPFLKTSHVVYNIQERVGVPGCLSNL